MDFEHLMHVQSALNDFTLKEKQVYLVDSQYPGVVVPNMVPASMSLRRRDGELVRHQSGLARMCDMYQWAGNREYLELRECMDELESELLEEAVEQTISNARIEVVDVMHFDLSLLALTCTASEDIEKLLERELVHSIDSLAFARAKLDDLQLTKWWTSNKVSVTTIRENATIQFATLLQFGCKQPMRYTDEPLFESFEDVVATYQKKVEVNYNRIKADYDHVADAEMGNAEIK